MRLRPIMERQSSSNLVFINIVGIGISAFCLAVLACNFMANKNASPSLDFKETHTVANLYIFWNFF